MSWPSPRMPSQSSARLHSVEATLVVGNPEELARQRRALRDIQGSYAEHQDKAQRGLKRFRERQGSSETPATTLRLPERPQPHKPKLVGTFIMQAALDNRRLFGLTYVSEAAGSTAALRSLLPRDDASRVVLSDSFIPTVLTAPDPRLHTVAAHLIVPSFSPDDAALELSGEAAAAFRAARAVAAFADPLPAFNALAALASPAPHKTTPPHP